MEITARLHCSHSPYLSLKPSFSDPSHLVFYGCSSSTQCKPNIKALLHTDLATSSPLISLQVTQPPLQSEFQPSLACNADSSIPSELDLLKELAVLKAHVKLKKKQLKAIAKERKTALKKKKTKGKCETSSSSSSSSSSSDSSDGGKGSMAVNKDSSQRKAKHGVSGRDESHGLLVGVDHTGMGTQSSDHSSLQGFRDEAAVARQGFRDEVIAGPSHGTLGAAISGSIEVCVGGKCKKAGSQQVLSSVKAQIPASANVDVSPCKCMGKCGSTINVKVSKEDTNPQHHSHVSVDDVGLILSHHFGLGPGLPCFSSRSPSSIPSISTAHV